MGYDPHCAEQVAHDAALDRFSSEVFANREALAGFLGQAIAIIAAAQAQIHALDQTSSKLDFAGTRDLSDVASQLGEPLGDLRADLANLDSNLLDQARKQAEGLQDCQGRDA